QLPNYSINHKSQITQSRLLSLMQAQRGGGGSRNDAGGIKRPLKGECSTFVSLKLQVGFAAHIDSAVDPLNAGDGAHMSVFKANDAVSQREAAVPFGEGEDVLRVRFVDQLTVAPLKAGCSGCGI